MIKKILLSGVVVAAMLYLIIAIGGAWFSSVKIFDKQFSVSPTSYKPYDIKFFHDQIEKKASRGFSTNEEALNDNMMTDDEADNLLMVVSPYFLPSEQEIVALKNYVSSGNYAFVSAFSISSNFLDSLFYMPRSYVFSNNFPPYLQANSLTISWLPIKTRTQYNYLGHSPVLMPLDSITLYNNSQVTAIDTLIWDKQNGIQLLELTCGKGKLFLSHNPIILSNYFLLHKDNYRLFNQIAQRIELADRYVVWDNHYRNVVRQGAGAQVGESKFMEIMHKYPPLTWAFYTFLAAILLFILSNFRRTQAAVAVVPAHKNQSLAFVNVISELYWQKQNYKAIADKIIAHFYEYMSVQYRINIKDFRAENAEKIAQKTGKDILSIKQLIDLINAIESREKIEKQDLYNLYKGLNTH